MKPTLSEANLPCPALSFTPQLLDSLVNPLAHLCLGFFTSKTGMILVLLHWNTVRKKRDNPGSQRGMCTFLRLKPLQNEDLSTITTYRFKVTLDSFTILQNQNILSYTLLASCTGCSVSIPGMETLYSIHLFLPMCTQSYLLYMYLLRIFYNRSSGHLQCSSEHP